MTETKLSNRMRKELKKSNAEIREFYVNSSKFYNFSELLYERVTQDIIKECKFKLETIELKEKEIKISDECNQLKNVLENEKKLRKNCDDLQNENRTLVDNLNSLNAEARRKEMKANNKLNRKYKKIEDLNFQIVEHGNYNNILQTNLTELETSIAEHSKMIDGLIKGKEKEIEIYAKKAVVRPLADKGLMADFKLHKEKFNKIYAEINKLDANKQNAFRSLNEKRSNLSILIFENLDLKRVLPFAEGTFEQEKAEYFSLENRKNSLRESIKDLTLSRKTL